MPRGKPLDPEILERMKEMDARGVNRSEIARQLGKHPSFITQKLGPKRPVPDDFPGTAQEPEAA